MPKAEKKFDIIPQLVAIRLLGVINTPFYSMENKIGKFGPRLYFNTQK